MKLINMTYFVLRETNSPTTLAESFQRCVTYANFLKQPLKLEMFVPVDEEGNFLEKPKSCSIPCSPSDFSKEGKCGINGCYSKIPKYEQAKEKVLFEGIDLDTAKYHCERNVRTIEYFTSFNVELTPNAIKQLGL